jgi:hypothetical protein
MNHMPRWKPITSGNLGVAGLAAIQGAAFAEKLRARGAMNGAIDATTAEQ